MLLCVPTQNVSHVLARKRIRRVVLTIRSRVVAEQHSERLTLVQPERVVQRVSRFMAEIAHRFVVALDRPSVLRLDPFQPLISEVEGNANQRSSVRTAPLIAQIHGRTECEIPLGKLSIEPSRQPLHARPVRRKSKLGDAPAEELRALALPLYRSEHESGGGKGRTEPSEKESAAKFSAALIIPVYARLRPVPRPVRSRRLVREPTYTR